MARYTPRLTALRFEDAVGLGMPVGPGQGDMSQGPVNAHNAEMIPVFDRDQFDGHVLGQDLTQDLSVTVSMKNESIYHATVARINDFVMRRGAFSVANTTSVSATPGLWAWKAILTFYDGVTTTTRTYTHCVGEIALAEARPANTFSIGFRNNGQVIDT